MYAGQPYPIWILNARQITGLPEIVSCRSGHATIMCVVGLLPELLFWRRNDGGDIGGSQGLAASWMRPDVKKDNRMHWVCLAFLFNLSKKIMGMNFV